MSAPLCPLRYVRSAVSAPLCPLRCVRSAVSAPLCPPLSGSRPTPSTTSTTTISISAASDCPDSESRPASRRADDAPAIASPGSQPPAAHLDRCRRTPHPRLAGWHNARRHRAPTIDEAAYPTPSALWSAEAATCHLPRAARRRRPTITAPAPPDRRRTRPGAHSAGSRRRPAPVPVAQRTRVLLPSLGRTRRRLCPRPTPQIR